MENTTINWVMIFRKVQQLCSGYAENRRMVQGELLSELETKGLKLDGKLFNQLVTRGLIKPVRSPNRTGYPEYDLLEIQKAFLVATVISKHKLRPAQLKIVIDIFTSKSFEDRPAIHNRDLAEIQRARLILTGRFLALISSLMLCKPKPPLDTIIICRELIENTLHQNFTVQVQSEEYVKSIIQPEKALIGWSTSKPNDEVFSVIQSPEIIQQKLTERTYYSFQFKSSSNLSYEVLLGPREQAPENLSFQEFVLEKRFPIDLRSHDFELLEELIKYGVTYIPNLERALAEDIANSRLGPDSDLITTLITSTLLAAPNLWNAAAFLADDGRGRLQIRAFSSNYPIDRFPLINTSSSSPGPFHWVFRNRGHLVIERLQEDDPRLPRGLFDPGTSHAFIPANLTSEKTVGVLHVFGRNSDSTNEIIFLHRKIELLYALARIVGEAHYRNIVSSIEGIRLFIPIYPVPRQGETQLRSVLADLLRGKIAVTLKSAKIMGQRINSYLTLFAIRMRHKLDLNHQEWFLNLIQQRAYQYLRIKIANMGVSYDGFPPIFDFGNGQLVLLVRELPGEDEVRIIREELQLEFDDIKTINLEAKVEIAVWSIHVPYNYLEDNFHLGTIPIEDINWQRHCDAAVNDLVSRTQDALKVIWQVKTASQLLINRDFESALAELEAARELHPDNSYILRHIAQALIELGRYEEAIKVASEAVKSDQNKQTYFASNHRRLADAYFGLGKFKEACEEMEKACEKSEDDPIYKQIYAQQLILKGDGENLKRALRMLLEIRSQIDQSNKDQRAWIEFLLGEVYNASVQLDKASKAFDSAARLTPGNPFISWQMLKQRHGNSF